MDLTATVCATNAAAESCKPLREQLLALNTASLEGRSISAHLAALSATVSAVEKATDAAHAAAGAAAASYAAKMTELHARGHQRNSGTPHPASRLQNAETTQQQVQPPQHGQINTDLQVNHVQVEPERAFLTKPPVSAIQGERSPRAVYRPPSIGNTASTRNEYQGGASNRENIESYTEGGKELLTGDGLGYVENGRLAPTPRSFLSSEDPRRSRLLSQSDEAERVLPGRFELEPKFEETNPPNCTIGERTPIAEPGENHRSTPPAPRKPSQRERSKEADLVPDFNAGGLRPQEPVEGDQGTKSDDDEDKSDSQSEEPDETENLSEECGPDNKDSPLNEDKDRETDGGQTWTRSRYLRNTRKVTAQNTSDLAVTDHDSDDDGQEICDEDYSDVDDEDEEVDTDEDATHQPRASSSTALANLGDTISSIPDNLENVELQPGTVIRASILMEFMNKLANERYGEMLDAILALQTSTYWSLRCHRHGRPPKSTNKTKSKSKKCSCKWRLCMRVVNEQEVIAAKKRAKKEDEREAQIEAAIVQINSFHPNHTGHVAESYQRGPGIDPTQRRRKHPVPKPIPAKKRRVV